MGIPEQLRGFDAYRYLGVPMSITLTSGEEFKGTLYCVDFLKSKTVILSGDVTPDGTPLHIINGNKVKSVTLLGPINQSIEEIPRISHQELMGCIVNLSHKDDDYILNGE